MKRVLMLASVASMISQFNMNHIRIILDLGYQAVSMKKYQEKGRIDTDETYTCCIAIFPS